MNKGVEDIGKKDVLWSYLATLFMVGSGVLLLPFILHKMPSETVGVWNIFTVITSLVTLLDFGFRPSFARNVSYIFSGVRKLQKEGVANDDISEEINYSLLAGTINAMRVFYRWMSLIVLFVLLTVGTAYFYFILQKYNENHIDAMVAWVLLIAISCYNLYTLYYDALLMGKGYVKRNQQITIIGQVTYFSAAIILIYSGFGLTAIISSKLLSVLIRRYLSYKAFFTTELLSLLSNVKLQDHKLILKAIAPNAIKVGCTNLGGFMVNRSATLMGSAFLSLEQLACYGITFQVIELLSQCGNVVFKSYIPKLAQYRAQSNIFALRKIYVVCVLTMVCIYLVGGLALLFLGDRAMALIGSNTHFLGTSMIIVMLIFSYLECNHVMSAGFISAGNRIPFFLPSILSGLATVFLLWVTLDFYNISLWGLILSPGIAQLCYQNWKWPSVVIKDLFYS